MHSSGQEAKESLAWSTAFWIFGGVCKKKKTVSTKQRWVFSIAFHGNKSYKIIVHLHTSELLNKFWASLVTSKFDKEIDISKWLVRRLIQISLFSPSALTPKWLQGEHSGIHTPQEIQQQAPAPSPSASKAPLPLQQIWERISRISRTTGNLELWILWLKQLWVWVCPPPNLKWFGRIWFCV